MTGTGVYSRISQEVFLRNKLVQEEVTTIHNRMSVIDLLPEEELLALQKEKELLIAKRAVGIQLLAEQNARLNLSLIHILTFLYPIHPDTLLELLVMLSEKSQQS